MAQIHKLKKREQNETKTIYPVTITDAVVDPKTEQSLAKWLELLMARFAQLEGKIIDVGVGDLRSVFKGMPFNDPNYVKLDGSAIDLEDYPGIPDALLNYQITSLRGNSMKPSGSTQVIPVEGEFICIGTETGTPDKVVLIGSDGYVYYNNKRLGDIGSGFVRGQLLTGAKYGFWQGRFYVVTLNALYHSVDGITWNTLYTENVLNDSVEDVVASSATLWGDLFIYLKVKYTTEADYKYYEIRCNGSNVQGCTEVTSKPIDVIPNGTSSNASSSVVGSILVAKAKEGIAIAISTDTINWEVVDTPGNPTFIGFVNGLFVFVFGNWDVYTSTDCRTFNFILNKRTSLPATKLSYKDGWYLLFSEGSIICSRDGITWKEFSIGGDFTFDQALICDGQIRLFCNHKSMWGDVYSSSLKPKIIDFKHTSLTPVSLSNMDWYFKFR